MLQYTRPHNYLELSPLVTAFTALPPHCCSAKSKVEPPLSFASSRNGRKPEVERFPDSLAWEASDDLSAACGGLLPKQWCRINGFFPPHIRGHKSISSPGIGRKKLFVFIHTHVYSALALPARMPAYLKEAPAFISKILFLAKGIYLFLQKCKNLPTLNIGESCLQGFLKQNYSLCLKMPLVLPSLCPCPWEIRYISCSP